jgi:hypothetical protein
MYHAWDALYVFRFQRTTFSLSGKILSFRRRRITIDFNIFSDSEFHLNDSMVCKIKNGSLQEEKFDSKVVKNICVDSCRAKCDITISLQICSTQIFFSLELEIFIWLYTYSLKWNFISIIVWFTRAHGDYCRMRKSKSKSKKTSALMSSAVERNDTFSLFWISKFVQRRYFFLSN